MLKKFIIILCLLITGCTKTNTDTNENQSATNELDSYSLKMVYDFDAQEGDIRKNILYADDEAVYYACNDYSYNAFYHVTNQVIKHNLADQTDTVICDYTNQNCIIDYLTVNNKDVYAIVYDYTNSINKLISINDEITVLEEYDTPCSSLYATKDAIYYVVGQDVLQIKCIQNQKIETVNTIERENCIQQIEEGGSVNQESFIYAFDHTIYELNSEGLTEYNFDYTVLKAIKVNNLLIIEESYQENGTGKFRIHYYDLDTKEDINTKDYYYVSLYSYQDGVVVYVDRECMYVITMTIDEQGNITEKQISEYEHGSRWTQISNDYYKQETESEHMNIYQVVNEKEGF